MVRKRKPKKNMKDRPRGGASVQCPKCLSDSEVLITRRDGDSVTRRRKCLGDHQHLFDTREVVDAIA